MAISLEEVTALKRSLEDDYRERHEAQRRLRDYWHGRYWQQATAESAGSISSIFRDLSGRSMDVGPDLKLVHNVLQQVCVKFQSFLTPLPMINVYVDQPETRNRRAQATRKERALYGTWSEARMNLISNRMGWYLPLMGDCFLGCVPDFDRNLPVPVLRSPEYAYPVPGFDGTSLGAVIFAWEVRQSVAKRTFPNYDPNLKPQKQGLVSRIVQKSPQSSDPMVEIIEYSDGSEFWRWVDGQKVNGADHGFGFNLFEQPQFIHVPDEPWGHGAVEQAVNLNEMGNALYSLLFQSVLENVFPRMVLIDPAKAPEEIDTGPGAVIPIQAGGSVEWLHPPVQAIGMQAGFLQQNEQAIKDAGGMSRVDFGESPASSIVTGKAVDALQGASSGNTVEMVQGTGIGAALESWNEKALRMYQLLWAGDKIQLGGVQPVTSYDMRGQMFTMSFKGSEIVGSVRNELTFQPAISMHEKVVMGLQMAGGGLVSKKWQRQNAGIADSDAMDEEIIAEAVQDGVLGAVLGELQQSPTPQTADKVEAEAYAYLQGATPAAAAPGAPPAGGGPGSPLMAAGGGPQPLPPGPAPTPQLPTQGPVGPPPGAGGPPAAGPPPAAAPSSSQGQTSDRTVTLQQAIQAFQQVQGITGKVYLVGEIVDRGQTDTDIEVAVTDAADRDTLNQSLTQYQGRLVFHPVSGDPQEDFVEVTPGSPPRPGGPQDQGGGQPPPGGAEPPPRPGEPGGPIQASINPTSSGRVNSVA